MLQSRLRILLLREHSSLLKFITLLAFSFKYLYYKPVSNTKAKQAKHYGNLQVNTTILNLLSGTFPDNIRAIFLLFDNAYVGDKPGTN